MSEPRKKPLAPEVLSALNDDPLGLLADVDLKPNIQKQNTPLVQHFKAILDFIDTHGREPSVKAIDMTELQLASMLQGIRLRHESHAELSAMDTRGLLSENNETQSPQQSNTVDDPLGLLEDEGDDSVFDLKNVNRSPRINPATIQRRKRCLEFDRYRDGFNRIKEDLRNGTRTKKVFSEKDLIPGRYFCLNGILMYLESLDISDKEFEFSSGNRTWVDGPVHAIFDNETESHMLYRSLVKAMCLPGEGFTISEKLSIEANSNVNDEDRLHGHIYVLKSLSEDSHIASIVNLFKIGYSENTVEQRVKDAEHESTYLRAPVRIIRDVEVYNFDAHEFESKLHSFFRLSNPSFTVIGEDGRQHAPKEWFVAPLEIIDRAIDIIASGQDDGYYYDPKIKEIVHA